jgi:transcriptional regulator with XRE-family HTH domain
VADNLPFGKRDSDDGALAALARMWDQAASRAGSVPSLLPLTQERLAEESGVPISTINSWAKGRSLPRHLDQLEAVGRALAELAGAGTSVPSVREWESLLETDRAARAAASREPGGRDSLLGTLLTGLADPFALEVHRPVSADGHGADLPALPLYVRRGHDDELSAAAGQAAGGRSVMKVLVGGSSTGKTRACWEAVHKLPAGWRLWHPYAPAYHEAVLAGLPDAGPRTIVWLNELQRYLLEAPGDAGERVAAALRSLLADPLRAPVLVLGTLWPADWATLTADAAHSQARELLAGASIEVPSAFTGDALTALHQAAASDERLRTAADHARDGQVAQYLAGAPLLLERYRHAQPAAMALVHAAMDARRLGHQAALGREFLEAAAPGYLSDAEWDEFDGDWGQALGYLAEIRKGVPGPVTRIRPRPAGPVSLGSAVQRSPDPAEPSAGQLYQLADYLDQHGRRVRATESLPGIAWQALAAFHLPGDAVRIAEAAEHRGWYRHAARLLHGAAGHDGTEAMTRMARLLDRLGRPEEAAAWWDTAAAAGDAAAMVRVGARLERQGRGEEALACWTAAAGAGSMEAPSRAAYYLESAGRKDEAQDWWHRAGLANHGDAYANRAMMNVLLAEGRSDEALWWAEHRCCGSWTCCWRWDDLARLLHRQGRTGEAIDFWKRTVQVAGDPDSGVYRDWLREAASLMIAAGRADEAVGWLAEYASHGDEHAWPELIAQLTALGRVDEAVQRLKDRAAERSRYIGDDTAGELADLLEANGRSGEALAWLAERAVAGDSASVRRMLGMLQAAGRESEARAWLKAAAESPDSPEPARLLGRIWLLLDAAGRGALALILVYEAADPWLLEMASVAVAARAAGYPSPDDAVREWEQAAAGDDPRAMLAALVLLQASGAYSDAMLRAGTRAVPGSTAAADDRSQVRAWLARKAEAGDRERFVQAAWLAAETGWAEEAVASWRRLAEQGDLLMRDRLIEFLAELGRADDAARYLQSAATTLANPFTESRIARLLIDAGLAEEAVTRLRKSGLHEEAARALARAGRHGEAIAEWGLAANGGNLDALEQIATLLDQDDQGQRARQLRKYGRELDGTISSTWQAPDPGSDSQRESGHG